MKNAFVAATLIGWFVSIGFIVQQAGKGTPGYTPANTHIAHTANKETTLPQLSLLFLSSGKNPVAAQYTESLRNDFDELQVAVYANNPALAAKNAKQLLCSLTGYEAWLRQHPQQSNLSGKLKSMAIVVQQISRTADGRQQADAFEKLCENIRQWNEEKQAKTIQ